MGVENVKNRIAKTSHIFHHLNTFFIRQYVLAIFYHHIFVQRFDYDIVVLSAKVNGYLLNYFCRFVEIKKYLKQKQKQPLSFSFQLEAFL